MYQRIFIKINSTYIKQTLRFLFKFLKINLGKRTLYYDLYCNIKTNVNSLRLMIKLREWELTQSQLSTGYKRSYRTLQ